MLIHSRITNFLSIVLPLIRRSIALSRTFYLITIIVVNDLLKAKISNKELTLNEILNLVPHLVSPSFIHYALTNSVAKTSKCRNSFVHFRFFRWGLPAWGRFPGCRNHRCLYIFRHILVIGFTCNLVLPISVLRTYRSWTSFFGVDFPRLLAFILSEGLS